MKRPALDLVMPMAGRGSRFVNAGMREPKPLLMLAGRPFFWWAVESARRALCDTAPFETLTFVVLEEHIREWAIDARLREFYPDCTIVALADVTAGSAATAAAGIAHLDGKNPIAINDCDHAFVASDLAPALNTMQHDKAAGGLLTFRSESPNYSYVELAEDGAVMGTVEKRVASPYAIAGCYLFRDKAAFDRAYRSYVAHCPYGELFMSGLYNEMLAAGERIAMSVLNEHFAFGTPEEMALVEPRLMERLSDWTRTP
jgi:CTP:molybdopterin cytidylyltransferase MocA